MGLVRYKGYPIEVLVEVLAALLTARWLVGRPMRQWLAHCQLEAARADQVSEELSAVGTPCARDLARCVEKVASRVPWRADCLPQALATLILLRRRDMSPRLVLGATTRYDSDQPASGAGRMDAHAWVELGGQAILGGGNSPSYARLVTFDLKLPAHRRASR